MVTVEVTQPPSAKRNPIPVIGAAGGALALLLTLMFAFAGPEPVEPTVEDDYSYDGARRSLDASLERLGLSRVDILLCHDIEPNRRFVEKDNCRPVEETGHKLHLHPLTQREFPHMHIKQVLNLEKLRKLGHPSLEFLFRNLIVAAKEIE